MSRLDNIDALEKQLAELQMTMEINTPKVKKIPPAVPPKKKAQPQVPHSTYVNKVREPSFSTKISPTSNISSTNNTTYSNIHHVSNNPIQKEYANLGQLKQVPAYYNDNVHPQNMSVPSKNYNPTYSNIAPYHNNDELPLPPPPPPPLPAANSYTYNHDHEEYLPPPSPVSSNYSELVRATTNLNYNQDQPAYPPIYQNEFNDYSSHNAPVFESLYEPISPRPNNNFTPTKSIVENYRTQSPNMNKSPLPKEEEVDALTNLLVQSISESQDLDVFGTCVKCQGKVIGESSGCTAMGNVYHIECFCCSRCKVNLQGKPFYAVEGNPYCEIDYYETLEKCSVCYKPILDRIIRATGKPYHPTCFSCVVCGKSLDGIPFTVDAMNQIHCIEDFHKKFAPRCCVCQLPIMPEEGQDETVRVVALDRSFHVRCYRCEDCGLHLSSEAEGRGCYPLDGHILCQQCNGHRIRLLTNVMTTDL